MASWWLLIAACPAVGCLARRPPKPSEPCCTVLLHGVVVVPHAQESHLNHRVPWMAHPPIPNARALLAFQKTQSWSEPDRFAVNIHHYTVDKRIGQSVIPYRISPFTRSVMKDTRRAKYVLYMHVCRVCRQPSWLNACLGMLLAMGSSWLPSSPAVPSFESTPFSSRWPFQLKDISVSSH